MLGYLIEDLCKQAEKSNDAEFWLNRARGVYSRHNCLIEKSNVQESVSKSPYDPSLDQAVQDKFGPVTQGTLALPSHV